MSNPASSSPAEAHDHHQRQMLLGYLAAFGTVAIWTGFNLMSRWGGKSPLTSYDLFALRVGMASLLLLPFMGSLPKALWKDARMWALAMIGGLLYGVVVYAGFKYTMAAHAAIFLGGMQPFFVGLVAWWLLKERPSRARSIGVAWIAVGVLALAVPYVLAGWSEAMLIGDALILVASLDWALYSVLVKRWSYRPWDLTRFVTLMSAVVYLPVYLLFLPKQLDAVPWQTLLIQALYQGIGPSIVAMLLFLQAVALLGAVRVGAIVALVPVLSGVAAAPLLDEPLTGWLMAGLVLVSLGAYVASRPDKPVPQQDSQPLIEIVEEIEEELMGEKPCSSGSTA